MIQTQKHLEFLHYPSKEIDKYECLSGEDLRDKAGVVEQAKFKYSPLGKFFNTGLNEKDKKVELPKILKNI